MNKPMMLLAAGIALAAAGARGETTVTFSLRTIPEAAVYSLNTMAKSPAYALETMDENHVRTIADKAGLAKILPLATWGEGFITVKLGDEVKDKISFTSDGTTQWTPDEKGVWTLVYSKAGPSGNTTAQFNVSSVVFIEGEGSKEEPTTAEDAEALEYVVKDIINDEKIGDDDQVYVKVGEEGGEPVTIPLDDGDGDETTVASIEIPADTTIAVDGKGTITIPEGTTVVVTIKGVPTDVSGLASVSQGEGGIKMTLAMSATVAFDLDTMGEAARFKLDTIAEGAKSAFAVETMADENNSRTIESADEVLPIAHWGTGTLTFTHDGGEIVTYEFSADGTYSWKPSKSGTWTVKTTGGTPSGKDTATFVFVGGGQVVKTISMTGINLGESGAVSLKFKPTFEDAGADGAKWLASAKESGLVKVRAATALDKLDTAEATLIDITALEATYDAGTGVVSFDLTGDAVKKVAGDAPAMFFKVEVQ